jgi:hypothetical protein
MFDPRIPAGEEAEFFVRLRAWGLKVVRLDADMAVHDSGMSAFGPWWRRCLRGGRAYAMGVARYGSADGGDNRRRLRSSLLWGALWPVLVLGSAIVAVAWDVRSWWFALALTVLAAAQVARTALRAARTFGWRDGWTYGCFCMLGKVPEALGILRMWARRTPKVDRE